MTYRLRYRRSETTHASNLPISGYGVELALKRTDYIVLDDRSHDEEAHADTLASATSLDDDEDVADIKPLASSDLSSLGLKAASFILQSDRPLDTLIKLTQDLPRFLTSVVAHNISSQIEEELQSNGALGVPEGMNVLLVNGVQLIERQIEPFALIERLRQERKLIDGFRALGLSGKQAVSILGHQSVSLAKDSDEPLRYDWTDRLEDGRVLIWLNDLENDDAYEHYPNSIASVSRNRLLKRTSSLLIGSSCCNEHILDNYLQLRKTSSLLLHLWILRAQRMSHSLRSCCLSFLEVSLSDLVWFP